MLQLAGSIAAGALLAAAFVAGCGGDHTPAPPTEDPAEVATEFVEALAAGDPNACDLATPYVAFLLTGQAESCAESVRSPEKVLRAGFFMKSTPEALTAELDSGELARGNGGYPMFTFCTGDDARIGLDLFYDESGWQVDSLSASANTVSGGGETKVQPCEVKVKEPWDGELPDDSPPAPAEGEEGEALAAVADYLEGALHLKDPEAACAALTDEAQRDLAAAIAETQDDASSQDCVQAFGRLMAPYIEQFGDDGPPPVSSINRALWIGPDVRAGELNGKPIEVTIDGSTAEVHWIPNNPDEVIPVEEVDGEWLVSDGTASDLLFSYGIGPDPD